MTDIPEWAYVEAARRCNDGNKEPMTLEKWKRVTSFCELAKCIAQHEQPPKDGRVEAMDRALRRATERWCAEEWKRPLAEYRAEELDRIDAFLGESTMTSELSASDDLVKRLEARTKRTLPAGWQKGLKCPECGSAAERPKCFWDMGGACPRHDPDNYDQSPYVEVPDKDCAAAAAHIRTQQAENAALRDQARKTRAEVVAKCVAVAERRAELARELSPHNLAQANMAAHIAQALAKLENPDG